MPTFLTSPRLQRFAVAPLSGAPPPFSGAPIVTTTRDVALLAYPDCQMLDVSGPWQVFASANDVLGKPAYRLRLIGRSASELVTNGGLRLAAGS